MVSVQQCPMPRLVRTGGGAPYKGAPELLGRSSVGAVCNSQMTIVSKQVSSTCHIFSIPWCSVEGSIWCM